MSKQLWPWLLLVTLIVGVMLSVLFAYTFVWTYLAEFEDARSLIAQLFAVDVAVGAVCTGLLLFPTSPAAGRMSQESHARWMTAAAYAVVASGMVAHRYRIDGELELGSVLMIGLVWAPLCAACFALVRMTILRDLRVAGSHGMLATLLGVVIGYAVLSEFGTFWLVGAATVGLTLYNFPRKRCEPESPGAESAAASLALALVALIAYAILNELPFGLDVATFLALLLACGLTGRLQLVFVAAIARSNLNGIAPAGGSERTVFDIEDVQQERDGPAESAGTGVYEDEEACRRPPLENRKWFSLGEAAVLACVCFAFVIMFWTEPRLAPPPHRPSLFTLPEPQFDPRFADHGSLRDYSDAWDEYNRVNFENALARRGFLEMDASTAEYNDSVRGEVGARRVAKVLLGMLAIGLVLTYKFSKDVDAPDST